MKLFDKKEEKNKVGRPKLADDETKKKAIISVCVALVLVITLALTGAFKLNIINFNKMKGLASPTLCTEIPTKYQPKSANNPDGIYDYGFTDPKFYSMVVSTYNTNATYCNTITEDELASLTSVGGLNTNIEDVNGIQYLKGITHISLDKNNISVIDLSENKNLEYLYLSNNNLTEIDLSENKKLKNLDLSNNDLSELNLSNNPNISLLHLGRNSNLKKVDLSGNTALDRIDINTFKENKNLEYLNLNGMTALSVISLGEDNHNLSSIDLSANSALTNIKISSNKMLNVDLSNNKELTSINIGKNISFSDLRNNPKLNYIRFYEADIENLDLSNNNVIQTFYATNSKVGNVNLSNNANLSSFSIVNNSIVNEANLSGLTSLKNIRIKDSTINKLNLNGSKSLNTFYRDSGNFKLGEADFSGTSFYQINLDGVGLRKIDVSNNEKISGLSLNNNELTEIKMENTPNLQYLYFNNNNVNNIDISSNKKLEYLEANNNNLSNIELENNTLLQSINLSNNKISKLDIKNLSKLYRVFADNNEISKISFSSDNILRELHLINNNLSEKLDLSACQNLEYVYLGNNKLSEVIFGNSEKLSELTLNNNNLSKVDLSNLKNLNILIIQNNPLANTVYVLKGKSLKYNENISLNENRKPEYNVDDNSIVSYKDGKLNAIKEGVTSVNMSNELILSAKPEVIDKCLSDSDNNQEYCNNVSEEDVILKDFLSQEIKVYDITSDVYKIDKENKTIDASGLDLDVSKINLTLEGLSGVVDKDTFIVKDGETVVDTYKILNMKKVVDKPSNGTTNNKTTTKKSGSNTKTTTKSNNKKTTTTEDLSDIEINGSFVSVLALQTVKNKDRNIVVKNDGITATINGKDIDKIEGNLDLSYELKTLKESVIYNEVKDKVTSGIVLKFNSNSSLPGKVLINVEVADIIKKNAGTKRLRLYSYKNGELSLVAKNINPKDKKLSFYVNELGSYVLTDKELTGKEIKEDTKLLESNDSVNKKGLLSYWWILLILIILGIIVYIVYKKNKNKND